MKTINLKKFIPCVYYFVPPCPACGSRVTGYYMKQELFNYSWSKEEALKHGEIVKQVAIVPEKNVFCETCGFEWYYPVRCSIVSKARVLQEINDRQLADDITQQKIDKIDQKEDEKKNHKFRHFVRILFNI